MEKVKLDKEYVSVVMPAYNAAKYIESSIKSVIEQNYYNWELIVVNDASSDNTVNIVKKFMETDSRIKLYNNEFNKGVAESRNLGIKMATGEWVAFLDSDDWWEKNKLQRQLEAAIKEKADFIFTGSAFINEYGERYKAIFHVPTKVDFKQLLKQNVISCSSVMIRTNILNKFKMEELGMHEDFAVWLQVLRELDYAYGVDEPLLIYRITTKSKSGNKFKAAIMTYKVYRYVGLNLVSSIFYWCIYVCRSLLKYKKIYDVKQRESSF
jgi:Glycosyltransferases involved in cell wall biogenesis